MNLFTVAEKLLNWFGRFESTSTELVNYIAALLSRLYHRDFIFSHVYVLFINYKNRQIYPSFNDELNVYFY